MSQATDKTTTGQRKQNKLPYTLVFLANHKQQFIDSETRRNEIVAIRIRPRAAALRFLALKFYLNIIYFNKIEQVSWPVFMKTYIYKFLHLKKTSEELARMVNRPNKELFKLN